MQVTLSSVTLESLDASFSYKNSDESRGDMGMARTISFSFSKTQLEQQMEMRWLFVFLSVLHLMRFYTRLTAPYTSNYNKIKRKTCLSNSRDTWQIGKLLCYFFYMKKHEICLASRMTRLFFFLPRAVFIFIFFQIVTTTY